MATTSSIVPVYQVSEIKYANTYYYSRVRVAIAQLEAEVAKQIPRTALSDLSLEEADQRVADASGLATAMLMLAHIMTTAPCPRPEASYNEKGNRIQDPHFIFFDRAQVRSFSEYLPKKAGLGLDKFRLTEGIKAKLNGVAFALEHNVVTGCELMNEMEYGPARFAFWSRLYKAFKAASQGELGRFVPPGERTGYGLLAKTSHLRLEYIVKTSLLAPNLYLVRLAYAAPLLTGIGVSIAMHFLPALAAILTATAVSAAIFNLAPLSFPVIAVVASAIISNAWPKRVSAEVALSQKYFGERDASPVEDAEDYGSAVKPYLRQAYPENKRNDRNKAINAVFSDDVLPQDSAGNATAQSPPVGAAQRTDMIRKVLVGESGWGMRFFETENIKTRVADVNAKYPDRFRVGQSTVLEILEEQAAAARGAQAVT